MVFQVWPHEQTKPPFSPVLPRRNIFHSKPVIHSIAASTIFLRVSHRQSSTSHFIRSFRESTGKTPYQFLLDRRVQRAQTLLRDPRASLTEVAKSSGFANQHHMARIFRSVTGMTPSAYRRSL